MFFPSPVCSLGRRMTCWLGEILDDEDVLDKHWVRLILGP